MSRPVPAQPRLPDWPDRLAAALEAARETPFHWGAHDCWLAAADVVLAVTGRDPAAADRGTYTSEEAAEARLALSGGLESHVAAALAGIGAADVPPAFAQRGDVVLVAIANQLLVGVVADHRVAVTGAERMQFVPPALALRAWAV